MDYHRCNRWVAKVSEDPLVATKIYLDTLEFWSKVWVQEKQHNYSTKPNEQTQLNQTNKNIQKQKPDKPTS